MKYNTRLIATHIITDVLQHKQSLNEALPRGKTKCKNAQDAALVQAMCFGVLRWYPKLQFVLSQLMQKPIPPKEQIVSYLLCVGLYQLMDMRIPNHAALCETVEATRLLRKPWAASLVNGVLRNYLRQRETIDATLQNHQHPLYLEACFAHPLWFIQQLKIRWPNHWEAILKANNEHPPLSIRVNTQKISTEDYKILLSQQSIACMPIAHTASGLIIEYSKDIQALPGFEQGYFSVQDGASQMVAPLLQLSRSLRVLDACSAPGGKTTHILELEPSLKELVAVDITSNRTQLIQENLKRLQLNATVLTANAIQPDTWWNGELFDRILIDAPCSATGIIRRHPDIKYLREPDDLKSLPMQQNALLTTLWPLLKRDGILVYTTCSIMPEENTQIIEGFLKSTPDAEIQPLNMSVGIPQSFGIQLLPGQNNCDGFYYAVIKKL